MQPRVLRILVASLAIAAVVATVGVAHARSEKVASYAYEQVWPAAVRFLRIDEGHTIIEKDADAGYVLFEIAEEGKRFRGALELVRTEDAAGRAAVKLILRIEDRPTYMEQGILERLDRKLRAELGAPGPAPEPAPTSSP